MELKNQIAVVTGGASGMGKATAEALLQCGMRVMVWDKCIDGLKGDALECDVRQADSVEQALEETIRRLGIPRVCVQCAGIAPAKRIVGKEGAMPLADFQRVIDVNLCGTFNVLRVMAAAMQGLEPLGDSDERGVIVNTASIAAYEGQIGQAAYSASKGGVVSLTLPAARELAAYGIRINTIAPGLVATPMLLSMPEEVQASLAASVPFPKRLGRPQEFAALVVHVIENCLINGAVLRLDGALRMQAR
jgi:NAD(P)-dependent dehydrogenase (short-subunit alcohol dehydrogenase family)